MVPKIDDPRNIPIAAVDLTCRVDTPWTIRACSGATFHGAMGQALQTGAPGMLPLYGYGGRQQATEGLPLILVPPSHERHTYAPGDTFVLGIRLFGPGTPHLPVFVWAVEHLGTRGYGDLGSGLDRGTFTVLHAHFMGPNGPEQRPHTQPEDLPHLTLGQCMQPPSLNTLNTLRITWLTRLRLQVQQTLWGMNQTGAVDLPFPLLMARIIGRCNLLARQCGAPPFIPSDEKSKLLNQAESIQQAQSQLFWQDVMRVSSRTRSAVPMGGLTGQITYTGHLSPFAPWLHLATWLHIGKNTGFGLGRPTLEWLA